MTKITCMIVEDEPVSQEILKKFIGDYPPLELLAVCNNAIEANDKLRMQSPELIFLDINMPKISGIDFYRSLSNPPSVIFTTAYPEYAVSGFEVNAVDYLVKPFPFERFLKAMNKVQDLMKLRDKPAADFILLQADKKMHKVNYSDILFVEAMGDYVKVFTVEKMLVVHHTLQKLQELLPLGNFTRIHKSYIIALERIDYLEGNMVVLHKHQIPIGQTYRTDFLAGLHKRNGV
jgi:DNA-binding LytR/AlgR family response regulator